ncbi:hypothetical protein Ciccas_011531, partial [Cichlidogyrus casuarinus]
KAGQIRDKFEKGETEKVVKTKRPAKVKYAGVASAKSKFMEEAERANEAPKTGERKMREITPPREGVNSGVIESKPQARAPGIVSADDPDKSENIEAIIQRTKDLRTKFKEMEEGVSFLATNNAHFVENDRSREGQEALKDLNAKERKEALLKMAEDANKNIHKINPLEELKRLAEEQQSAVFENSPQERSGDVVQYSGSELDDFKALSSAKSTREKFLDGTAYKSEIKKTQVEIAADAGGVFENEPEQRNDVVKYEDGTDDNINGKWASEAKKRLMESAQNQEQSQGPKPLEIGQGGIYENKPRFLPNVVRHDEPASIDAALLVEGMQNVKANRARFTDPSASGPDTTNPERISRMEEVSQGKYASDARAKFLQRQKDLEDTEKKARPEIIDIWSDLCQDSGVFENQPAARPKDMVVCGMSSDEEDEAPVATNGNGIA